MKDIHRPMVFADRLFVKGHLEDNVLSDKVVELSLQGKLDGEVYFKDKQHLPELQVARSVEMMRRQGYNVSFVYKPEVAVIYFNGKH